MGIADTASGPAKDNASKANGIDDAIAAAFDASESAELSESIKSDGEEKPAPLKAKDIKSKAKSEPVEKADDEPTDEDAAEVEAKPEGSGEDDIDQTLSAPKHWPETRKQAFAKLTREGQAAVLEMSKDLEGGFTRKSQELSDKARFADSVRGLFDDTARAQLQSSGLDEVGYVRYLHSLQQYATQKPVEYVKWAMQNLGVKPDQLGISQATTQPAPEGQPKTDDELAALLADPKVSQLEAQVARLTSTIEEQMKAKQQAEYAQRTNAVNQLNTHIRGFRESLDEHGQLQYPHFDTVRGHMAALMDSDPDLAKLPDGPDKLKAAYDMAVWSRPDLRQSFIEAEAQRKIQDAQKKRDAERARKATSVKPAAGVVSTKPKAQSLDDALSQSMAKLGL